MEKGPWPLGGGRGIAEGCCTDGEGGEPLAMGRIKFLSLHSWNEGPGQAARARAGQPTFGT